MIRQCFTNPTRPQAQRWHTARQGVPSRIGSQANSDNTVMENYRELMMKLKIKAEERLGGRRPSSYSLFLNTTAFMYKCINSNNIQNHLSHLQR